MTCKSIRTAVTAHRANWMLLVVVLVGVAALPLTAGLSAAQQQTWTEDFEDGDADGWTWGSNAGVVQESHQDNYSLQQSDGYANAPEDAAYWRDGPLLDLSKEFDVRGVAAQSGGSSNPNGARIGLLDPNTSEAIQLAFGHGGGNETKIRFHDGTGETIGNGTINSEFERNDVGWFRFRLYSPPNSDEVRAKVWDTSESEPSNWQLSTTIQGFSGYMSIEPGASNDGRQVWLDDVTVNGEEAQSPSLELDHRQWIPHGGDVPYNVYDENASVGETDVTDNATVTSSDPSVVSVNQSTHQLVATSDENVSRRVTITADYDGRVTTRNVTVAEINLNNVGILPRAYWIPALVTDSTIQWLALACLVGALIGRVTNPWAAIGTIEILLLVGWLGAWVTTGLMGVSVFTVVFLGLTLLRVKQPT